jgi:phosphohistidine phosphatase
LNDVLEDTGPFRDTGIHLGMLQGVLAAHPELEETIAALKSDYVRTAKRTMKRLGKLDLKEFRGDFREARKVLVERVGSFEDPGDWFQAVAGSVQSIFNEAVSRTERLDANQVETIHQLRLAFKHFRYTVEAAEPVMGTLPKAHQQKIEDFQTRMGDIQDAATLVERLKEVVPDGDGVQRAIAEIEARRDALIRDVVRDAANMAKLWDTETHLTIHTETSAGDEAGMNVFLLRHGEAISRGTPGYETDRERPLTPKGKRDIRRIARGMRSLGLVFDAVVSSPYPRSKETADIVAKAVGDRAEIAVSEHLAPDGDPSAMLKELEKYHQEKRNVLLVGHEPYLSGLISLLVAGDLSLNLGLRKGALCKVSVEHPTQDHTGTLRWLLTPKQLISLR